MKYEVILTANACIDLQNIFMYIAFNLQSPLNATNQLNRLEEGIDTLEYMPYRFVTYDEEPWHSRNTHIMPIDSYRVLYIPDDIKKMVTVLRIIYAGSSMEDKL